MSRAASQPRLCSARWSFLARMACSISTVSVLGRVQLRVLGVGKRRMIMIMWPGWS